MQFFFDSCVAAGPERCAFYSPDPATVAENLAALYDSVRAQPVPVRNGSSYGLVDYPRLRQAVFQALYKPWAKFHPLAQALSDLAKGDGDALFSLADQDPFECSCNSDTSNAYTYFHPEAQAAILCNDAAFNPRSVEDVLESIHKMANYTSWYDVWGRIRAGCSFVSFCV